MADYLKRLGLAAAVDRALRARGRAQLTHGEVICALVANRLCDPRPLYDIRGWADQQGAQALLGTPAALLNDDRLGRALDALARVIDEVKGALCLQALARFGCQPKRLHWDFTSVAVYGSHSGSALIRFGHSSDKKAHLRQAKLGQAVSEDGVTLYHRTENGARNETAVVCQALEDLKLALGDSDFLMCGDTALVSESNLRALIADQISFLAPLPSSWGCHERYLKELSPERLVPIDYVSEPQRKLPAEKRTHYRGAELPWLLKLDEDTHIRLRALFVHSSEEETAIRNHAALLAYFKEQERVERGHRTLNGPLHVRPLFVQNDDRITALLAVCCFALMIYTLIERDARRCYPDGLPALGERRTGPATARAVLHLLQDTTLLHAGDSHTIEPPANARELYQRLTA